MEPIATAAEIAAMDDTTFLKAVKAKQLEEAQTLEQIKTIDTTVSARDAELKAFDEETQKQISNLQVSRSQARTVIEQNYAAQISALKPVIIIKEPIIEKVI